MSIHIRCCSITVGGTGFSWQLPAHKWRALDLIWVISNSQWNYDWTVHSTALTLTSGLVTDCILFEYVHSFLQGFWSLLATFFKLVFIIKDDAPAGKQQQAISWGWCMSSSARIRIHCPIWTRTFPITPSTLCQFTLCLWWASALLHWLTAT